DLHPERGRRESLAQGVLDAGRLRRRRARAAQRRSRGGRRTRRVIRAALLCVMLGAPLAAQARFPDSWVGSWSGTLTTTMPPDQVRNQIPVSLLIAAEPSGGAYVWRTIFDADSVRGRRDHRLVVRDAAQGFFAIDEGNDVVIEATYVDGALVGVFQVGD